MVTYSISKTNANIGETVTVSRSENINICYTFWVIDLQPSDYSCSFLQGANNLNSKGKIFSYHNSLSETVTLSDRHSITHKLTPITVGVPITQYINGILTTPIYEMQGNSIYTVNIGEPIEVNFNRNIYNQLKFLVNRWTKGKENTSNKVTSISSSSTDTQYPSAKCVFDKLNGYLTSNEEVIFVNGTNQSTDTTTNTFTGTTSKLDSINSVVDGTKLIYKVSVTSTNDTNDLRLSLGTNSGVVERYIKSDNTYTTANLYPTYTLLFLVFFNSAWHIIGQSNPKLKNRIVDLIYPIGSIYMSVNNVSPQTLFGGTWEQIEDTFLLSSGNSYELGDTGGEATHTLTISEMPSHTHTQKAHSHTIGSLARYIVSGNGNASVGDGYGNTQNYHTGSTTAINQNTGGGGSHNNMPPYLVVNVWKRIS